MPPLTFRWLGGRKLSNIIWNNVLLDEERIANPHVIMEILWDLAELNFRFELTAIDEYLCDDDHLISLGKTSPQYLSILKCCRGLDARFVLAPSVTEAGTGLAAPALRSRVPYLLALWDIMSVWQGVDSMQLSLHIPDNGWEDIAENELQKLEETVAGIYSALFYKVFGWPPIIPHGLW